MGILSIVRQQQKEGKISYEGRIYGVHRLDKVTSGILLLAKSSEIAKLLSEAFRDKTVTKYYIALSNKKPKKKKQGWVKVCSSKILKNFRNTIAASSNDVR
eukprot:845543_1